MMTSVRRLQVAFCRRAPMAAKIGSHCLRMRASDPQAPFASNQRMAASSAG
jgi:hypothetical protein